MITVNSSIAHVIDGLGPADCGGLEEYDPIRQAEIVSIRRFLEANRDLLVGKILDFGCGKPGTCREPQPFRHLIDESQAEYHPYDVGDDFPAPPFDVILCTQVLQFIEDPAFLIKSFGRYLRPVYGTLILTYPTNWSECEGNDLWRFTKAGVERMLDKAGFAIQAHERRAEVRIGPCSFVLGYGVVAVAR